MKIAVAGGTGFVGSNLLDSLKEGHETVCIDRNRSDVSDKSVVADVSESSEYQEALEDVDVAFYLIHGMSQGGDFSEIERECAEAFRDACGEAGVDRIIYLTGMIPDGKLSKHMESRTKTGEILGSGDPDLTEVGAAIILGWQGSSFQIMYQIVKKLPVILGPRSLNSKVQPIHIDDVIYYLEELMTDDEARGEYVEIGGPEVFSYGELLEILGEQTGRRPLLLRVPFLTPRLSSYGMRFVTDVDYSLAKALVESIKHDMVVRNDSIDRFVEHECMSYRDSIQKILDERK